MIPFARFGVYLHFPYCLSKCPYCDFASQVEPDLPHARYAAAVLAELSRRAPDFAGRKVETVYFGGGTPSLWAPDQARRVLQAVRDAFEVAPDAEVTLEVNPGAAEEGPLEQFRAMGFNRLSMGVQSFRPPALKALGRRHTGDEAETGFRTARAAGFDNISLDLLYGSAGHSVEIARSDAARAAALQPEHLSAYALTLEAQAVEVPMAKELREGRLTLPDDETTAQMGEAVRDVLKGAGYDRYEISNYARNGLSSRHNALYWKGGEYLALGAGATGYRSPDGVRIGGGRYTNTRAAEGYMAALEQGRLPEKTEALTAKELLSERLMLGLRLTEGVDLEAVCAEFDTPSGPVLSKARRLVVGGWATLDGARITLTERGMDLHTEAAARLI